MTLTLFPSACRNTNPIQRVGLHSSLPSCSARAPTWPGAVLPQREGTIRLISVADKQQVSDPGFSKRPPFPSVSVTMPILRAFSLDCSPVLRLMGKILPSFGSTSQLWSWLKLSWLLWAAIAEHTELSFPAHLEKELTDVTSTEDWHLFLKMH